MRHEPHDARVCVCGDWLISQSRADSFCDPVSHAVVTVAVSIAIQTWWHLAQMPPWRINVYTHREWIGKRQPHGNCLIGSA